MRDSARDAKRRWTRTRGEEYDNNNNNTYARQQRLLLFSMPE